MEQQTPFILRPEMSPEGLLCSVFTLVSVSRLKEATTPNGGYQQSVFGAPVPAVSGLSTMIQPRCYR